MDVERISEKDGEYYVVSTKRPSGKLIVAEGRSASEAIKHCAEAICHNVKERHREINRIHKTQH